VKLQIAVHRYHDLTQSVIEASGQGSGLPVIARKLHDLDTRIRFVECLERFKGSIRTAVVDKNDLVRRVVAL